MATITGFTATRLLAMEAATIVSGAVVGDNLILTKHDATTVNAGNVRGPTGSPGVSQAQLDTFILTHVPVGVIYDYIGTAAPNAKWLLMTGQTIVNGQTLYPDLWALLPASMKSGSSIVMPNTKGKVSVGYDSTDTNFDAIGETGGEKTHVLTQAELPAASVTIDPPNLVISINPPNLVVTIDPPATAVTGSTGDESVPHFHSPGGHAYFVVQDVTAPGAGGGIQTTPGNRQVTEGGSTSYEQTMDATNHHQHPAGTLTVDIPAFNVNVDIPAFNQNVDIPSFNSGFMGSGTAHNNLQPYIVFQKIIKALA